MSEVESSAFDFISSQQQLSERQSRPSIKALLKEAVPIRRRELELLPANKVSTDIGLNRARGIWTPINYDKKVLHQIPVTIYSSGENTVVKAEENHDINRAISSVTQLRSANSKVENKLQLMLQGIEEGKYRNIAVLNAHGEDTYQRGLGFWGYYGKDVDAKMVFSAVKRLGFDHDLIILAVCNPGKTTLPETYTDVPVFYPIGSVNAVGNIPGSLLGYVGPQHSVAES